MSDAGDDIPIDAPEGEVEVTATEAPEENCPLKKLYKLVYLSVLYLTSFLMHTPPPVASLETLARSRWSGSRTSGMYQSA